MPDSSPNRITYALVASLDNNTEIASDPSSWIGSGKKVLLSRSIAEERSIIPTFGNSVLGSATLVSRQGNSSLVSGKKAHTVTFRPSSFFSTSTPKSLGTFFAILSAIGTTTNDNSTHRVRGVIFTFKDNANYGSTQWLYLPGIDITTALDGNDVILPYGVGNIETIFGSPWREQTVLLSYVDRGFSNVNVGDGEDVVIGGYGEDQIGSWKGASDFNKNATGSKFFIGGSNSDSLHGGSASDLLVGDRWNGYELYIPSNALTSVPGTWKNQVSNLKGYQPAAYTDGTGAGFSLLGVVKSKNPIIPSRYYPLWTPGNDKLYGYDDNDTIYGDDNTIETNLYQLETMKRFIGQTPNYVIEAGGAGESNWDKIKLGADLIDAGAGNDQIYAGVGADAIIGGAGADLIDAGPQIVVPGYNPFFGLKVIYGDSVNEDPITGYSSNKSSADINAFMIGGLYSTENELVSSNSGELDTASAARQTVAEQLANYGSTWKKYGKFVKLIPKAGAIIGGIMDAINTFYGITQPNPAPLGNSPKAADALTIIKDFNPVDLLTIKLAQGESLRVKQVSGYTISGSKDLNPLAGNIVNAFGTILEVKKDAGTTYDRVFLEGYTAGLILVSPTSDSTVITYGGSDYAGVLNDQGQPMYPPIVGSF